MNINDVSAIFTVVMPIIGIGILIIGIIRASVHKKNGGDKTERIGIIAKAVGYATMLLILGFGLGSWLKGQGTNLGEYVMASHPSSIDSITYGQALNGVCEDIEWSSAMAENGNRLIIQMDAECVYDNREEKIVIQFDTHEPGVDFVDEETEFKICFVGIGDEEEVEIEWMKDIIYEMFEIYAEDHGINLQNYMREGILQTAGW